MNEFPGDNNNDMSDIHEPNDKQVTVDNTDNEHHSGDEINSDDSVEHETLSIHKKPRKKGILYLSTIPPFMNVTKVRDILGQYGKIGRVFLQPAVPRTVNGRLW